MKKTLLSITLLMFGICQAVNAATPTFEAAPLQLSFDNGSNFSDLAGNWLEFGSFGSPEFADWNNDGKKDLLVGFMKTGPSIGGGYMNVFINSGTDSEPKFTTGFRSTVEVYGG